MFEGLVVGHGLGGVFGLSGGLGGEKQSFRAHSLKEQAKLRAHYYSRLHNQNGAESWDNGSVIDVEVVKDSENEDLR